MSNLSLCSGYGGLDLAVEQITGNKTLVYAENDKYAAQVMAARFPWATNLGDIKTADWAAIAAEYAFTTITAGFPCQDISHAGKRKGITGARSGIWKNVAEAVRVIRPRRLFMENVAGIRSRGLETVVADLAAIGYDVWWTCLRAGDDAVGAPHPRDRWFGIAHPAAEDPDIAAWRERWAAASGEAQGGRARADAGGRGRVPAARSAGSGAAGAGLRLLPSPSAGNFNDGEALGSWLARRDRNRAKGINGNGMGTPLSIAVRLADESWVTEEGVDYGPAIRRWEAVLGRPAPMPTEPGDRGNRRLSPVFVEWFMGCDEGWVTDLGLKRNQQLKILGNGVVTRQAIEAYRRLLCADLDAMAA